MKDVFKFIPCALLAVILTTGCDTKDLHEMNINPNALNTMPMQYFFTIAELGLTSGGMRGDDRYLDWRTNIGMCAHCTQQLAIAETGLLQTGDKYVDNDPEVNAAPYEFWTQDCGKNCAEVLKQLGEGGNAAGTLPNILHATRIIKALNFGRLTDMYGSVPYTEADKGLEGIFYPHYDKQKVVYTDILKELDEASTALDASLPDDGMGYADLIYAGDITKWKRFGHSLMLRYGLRVYNADNAMGLQYINKAIAGGVFTSTDDDVFIFMADGPEVWTNQNGISRGMLPGDGGQANHSLMAKTLIDWLMGPNKASTADDDPRLMIYSGGIGDWPSPTTLLLIPGGDDPLNQVGLPNGKNQSMLDAAYGHPVVVTQTFSRVNPLLLDTSDPYRLMTYAETELLLAECLERGIGTGITGTAQQHYENGVRAAMQSWTPFDASFVVTDAKVDAYLAAHPFGVEKPALEMIGNQIWANHFMNWFEAWSEWRRTGYPLLVPVNYPGNDTNGTIPVRLRYPASEVSGNPNYKTEATTPDKITTKLWWMGGVE
jgi:hypothetical protein